jgi:hypothetical protein
MTMVAREAKVQSERLPMPADVAQAHQMWRLGFGSIVPYAKWHAKLARTELKRLVATFGLETHGEGKLASDGWFDGMKVLHIVAETPTGNLLKLKWHDGNQGFMKCIPSAGSTLLTAKDLI